MVPVLKKCVDYTVYYKYPSNKKNIFTCLIQPSKEMNMMTPMNCEKRMRGVKKDHTGHSAILKLQRKTGEHDQIGKG